MLWDKCAEASDGSLLQNPWSLYFAKIGDVNGDGILKLSIVLLKDFGVDGVFGIFSASLRRFWSKELARSEWELLLSIDPPSGKIFACESLPTLILQLENDP